MDIQIKKNIKEEAPLRDSEFEIKQQVANDLETYLSTFPKLSQGLTEITHKTGLSTRSLTRYLKKETTPQIKVLIKLYKELTKSSTDYDLKSKTPSIILKRIGSFLEDNYSIAPGKNFSILSNNEFLSNKAFRYIYISTASHFLTREKIQYLFGKSGSTTLSQMIEEGIVKVEKSNRIISGKNRLTLNSDSFQLMATELIQNHFHTQRSGSLGENSYRYFLESVDLETYNQLLDVDEEASRKKIEILRNKKGSGDIPFWSISVIDNLLQNPLYSDCDGEVIQ